jgi:hypothetical protein
MSARSADIDVGFVLGFRVQRSWDIACDDEIMAQDTIDGADWYIDRENVSRRSTDCRAVLHELREFVWGERRTATKKQWDEVRTWLGTFLEQAKLVPTGSRKLLSFTHDDYRLV